MNFEVTTTFLRLLMFSLAISGIVSIVVGYIVAKETERRVKCFVIGAGYVQMTPLMIWHFIIEALCSDNGFRFKSTSVDFSRVTDALITMRDAGYFVDDPFDTNSSFWMMAAGECEEKKKFFSREPEAFQVIENVLNEIFERDP